MLALGTAFAVLHAAWSTDTTFAPDARPPFSVATGSTSEVLESVRVRVVGRVRIEVDETNRADAARGGGGPHPPASSDVEPRTDGADGIASTPAPRGTCLARVWLAGRLVGEAACDEQGEYAVELPQQRASRDSGPSRVAVDEILVAEILVPGHLRGYLEFELAETGDPTLPTVALGTGFEASGQVVDRSGKAVPGARITAMPSPHHNEREPWRAESDAHGNFRFQTLPVGPVSLRASLEGHVDSVMEAVAPEAGVLIVLDRITSLHGQAVAAGGVPEGTIARLEGSAVWPPRTQKLAPDGGFVFSDLPDGVYAVEVIAPGSDLHGSEFASIPLENVTPDLRLSLALIEAFRVPVLVVDPHGRAVEGARLSLGYAAVGMLSRRSETDADGQARLGPVVPGPYLLRVSADGFLPPDPVEVDVRGFVEQITLALTRPGQIEGIVRDDRGLPVADAEVVVDTDGVFDATRQQSMGRIFRLARRSAGGSLGVTSGKVPGIHEREFLGMAGELGAGVSSGRADGVRTDAEGRFVLDLLPAGRYRLHARHPAFAQGTPVEFELSSSETRVGVVLLVGEGFPVTGRVRDTNGRPVSGAGVEVNGAHLLWTDDRGVFDAGMRRGPLQVQIRKQGMVPRRIEVDVRAGGADLEVVLVEASERWVGRVRNANSQPIGDVFVVLAPLDPAVHTAATATDERGVFELVALAPGPAELRLSHPDYLPIGEIVRVGEASGEQQEFVLERSTTVRVQVRTRRGGEPIAGARISGARVSVVTDTQGWATLAGVPVGVTVELRVVAAGMVPAVARVGGQQREWIIELEDGGAMRGVVTDEIGEVLRGARVVVTTDGARSETRTGADGSWHVEGLPEGVVRVEARPPPERADGLRPATVDSDVRRGHTTRDVHIRLERGDGEARADRAN